VIGTFEGKAPELIVCTIRGPDASPWKARPELHQNESPGSGYPDGLLPPDDALAVAKANPTKKSVFLGIGFEPPLRPLMRDHF